MQLENTPIIPHAVTGLRLIDHRVFCIPQEKLKPSMTMYLEESGSTSERGVKKKEGTSFIIPSFPP
jgi:hypothetical protein